MEEKSECVILKGCYILKKNNIKLFYQILNINIIILFLVQALILTGCWDYTEYEDMVLIDAIGIDIGENENEIALTISYPSTLSSMGTTKQESGNKGKVQDIVFISYGRTIPEAINHMQKMMSREIFLGYASVVVIGQKSAEKHIEKILNYIDTSPTIRMSSHIIITPGKASDLLRIVNTYEGKSVSNSLNDIFNTTEDTGATFPIMLKDFYKAISIEGYEPVASSVIIKNIVNEKDSSSQHYTGLLKRVDGEIQANGMAVFDGYRFVGWLNEKESRGWGLITNKKIQDFTIVNTSKDNYFTYRILNNKSEIKTFIDDEIYITVEIKVRCSIDEFSISDNLNNPAVIQDLEKKITENIKEDVKATVKRVQTDIQSDVFGIGFQVLRQNNKQWKQLYRNDWEDIFPDIPIHIDVSAKVLHTGYINEPLEER